MADNRAGGLLSIVGRLRFAEKWMLVRGLFVVWWLFAGLTGCGQESTPDLLVHKTSVTVQAVRGTIVAVGDSLTAGLGVDEDQAYPAQLERKLRSAGYAFKVINAGVSGETSSGAWSRIHWVVSSLKPDIVILETGANDGLRGIDPKTLESNLEKLASFLKEKKIVVILAGMRMLPNLGPDYVAAFSYIYPRIAKDYDLILIPFFLEGVAGQPAYNQADGIHPTAEGYSLIVDLLYPSVQKAIQKHLAQKAMPGK
jgi:acyl-CoA thioesterase-1